MRNLGRTGIQMTTVDVLARLPILATFDRAELEALAARTTPRTFASGTALMRQGDFGASMFIITSGKARVTLHAPGGPKEIATLAAGDLAGEISLLTGAARTATVTASGKVEAVEIDKQGFAELLADRRPLVERIVAIIEQRRAELGQVKREAQAWRDGGLSYDELVAKMTQFYAR